MKELKYYIRLLLVAFVIVSCTEDNDDKNNSNVYLTEYKEVTKYSQSTIKFMFNVFLTGEYINYSNLSEKIVSGVKLYKVKYKTKFKGEDIIASGLISIPDENLNGISYMSYHHGTVLDKNDAPTEGYTDIEYRMISFLASLKYIVLIPDYIGLGESSQFGHPYMCKQPTTTAIIDFMKAAKEFVNDMNISGVENNLYMLGYSQGGWATMSTLKELESSGLVDHKLMAVSCGGSPFNIQTVHDDVLKLGKYNQPYYLPYVFKSYSDMGYLTVNMENIFNSKYIDVIKTDLDGSLSGDKLNEKLTNNVAGLFTSDYLINHNTDDKYREIKSVFKDNSVEPWNLNTRLFIHHGKSDSTILYTVSEKMYNDLISMGVSPDKVSFHEHEGLNHTKASLISILESINQFDKIKNGVPAMALTSE